MSTAFGGRDWLFRNRSWSQLWSWSLLGHVPLWCDFKGLKVDWTAFTHLIKCFDMNAKGSFYCQRLNLMQFISQLSLLTDQPCTRPSHLLLNQSCPLFQEQVGRSGTVTTIPEELWMIMIPLLGSSIHKKVCSLIQYICNGIFFLDPIANMAKANEL